MDIMTFIPNELLIVVIATYTMGSFLKNLKNTTFKDKFIPITLMIFSIIFSLCLTGFNTTSLLQGILCWGAATGLNQVLVQSKKEE